MRDFQTCVTFALQLAFVPFDSFKWFFSPAFINRLFMFGVHTKLIYKVLFQATGV